jgi:hypothetical protein
MFTLPIRSFRWSTENARVLGVAGALVLFLCLKVRADPQADVFAVLAFVLPALEVTMFAGIFAVYKDSIADVEDRVRGLAALPIWFGLCLAIIWLNAAFVRAGIDAYVKLGVPPAYDFTL